MNSKAQEVIVIEAGHTERQYWQDLWRYRELFYFLAWRDILVRYKQTVIGVAWALIRPFLTMVVFTIIFGKVAQLPSDGEVPYQVMVFAGTLPWQFFSGSLQQASQSLIGNVNLISKVYCPRLIIPATAVVVSFVDFLVAGMIMLALMAWYNVVPNWKVLVLPLLILVAAAASLGIGLWFSALNVRYRDVKYIVPFVVQFGTFISPVGFSTNVVPEQWRLIYSLNPMVGVIDGFRWALLGGQSQLYLPGFLLSLVLVGLLLLSGIWYFRQVERTFADVI